jgi:hypothetical protein
LTFRICEGTASLDLLIVPHWLNSRLLGLRFVLERYSHQAERQLLMVDVCAPVLQYRMRQFAEDSGARRIAFSAAISRIESMVL